MRRPLLAVAAGILAQSALLAAVSGLPHHHPTVGTIAFRVLSVGAVGGFVAATAAGHASFRVGVASGIVTGVGVGTGFWWLVFYGDTVGVFHHLHYALVTTTVLVDPLTAAPRLVVAGGALVVAVAFAVGGTIGGYAANRRP